MSHTFAQKIQVFKLASHRMHLTYFTETSDKTYLSLLAVDHLIAQQETEARMLMKQIVNNRARNDWPICNTYT